MINPSAGNVFIDQQLTPNYLNGMQVQWASTTTLSVSAGVALDQTGESNILLENAVTLNAANVGINGLDTGALGASSDYYVYAVGRSTDKTSAYQGVIMSLDPVQPSFSSIPGFDCARLIDYQKTDGASLLLKNSNTGNYNERTKWWDAAISVLIGGASQSLAPIPLSAALPPGITNMPVHLSVSFTPNVAGNKVSFAPFGSTSISLPGVSGSVSAVAQLGNLSVLSKLSVAVPNILYINSAATGATTVLVTGYDFEV